MVRPLVAVAFAIALAAGGVARADEPPAAAAFVRVEGDHFAVGDKRFAFVGANLQIMHGERVQSRYKDTLGAAAADGLGVARVWAFGEGPADASAWYRAHELFRAGPEGFIEDAYRHLDRVIAEAAAKHLRLVVTLSNNWSDYGGVPMYLRWAGLPEGTGPDDPAREAFYSDDKVRGFFRQGVARLLERTNSATGVRYVDDPTILSWELMNESSVLTSAGAEARRAWLVEMARFIKARDPHHLVASGVAGYDTRSQRAEWLRVHQLPEIDYCDAHLYPEALARVQGDKTLYALLDDHAQLARFVVRKPLVIGEFGFRTDLNKPWRGARRAAWFGRLVGRAFDDGIAGAMAWIYQPWSGRPRDFGIYIDRADTDDVRAVMRALAVRARAAPEPTNALLGPELGAKYLYDPRVTVRQKGAPQRRWRREAGGWSLGIAPGAFSESRFERTGASPGGALAHVYGAGFGEITYRFTAPEGAKAPGALRIRARMSSEWPGFTAPPDGGSSVEVWLDGARVGTVAAVPDDGVGKVAEAVLADRAVLAKLPGATHRLRFVVPDTATANGLCLYASPSAGGVGAMGNVVAASVQPGGAPIAAATAAAAIAATSVPGATDRGEAAADDSGGGIRIDWERRTGR